MNGLRAAMRALIVDDDETYRLYIRAIMRDLGWTVGEAWDGQVGWQMFQAATYDLVVTDIVMPNQEGLETIRLIRACRPGVRIVAISGGGRLRHDYYLDMARWFGADQVLAKSFSPRALQTALASLTVASG